MIQKGRQYVMEYAGREFIIRMYGGEFPLNNAIVEAKKFLKKNGIKFDKKLLVVKGYIDFEFDDKKIKNQKELGEHIAKHKMVSF